MNFPGMKVGDEVFTEESTKPFGAIRKLAGAAGKGVEVFVENHGDMLIPHAAITAAHDGKVIVAAAKLDAKLRAAIKQAHDAEFPRDGDILRFRDEAEE